MVHVPYKGGAAAITDMIGGRVSVMFLNQDTLLPQVTSGKLRALAVTSDTRVAALPEVPTFAELNYPTVNLTTWYGMWAPAQTPSALVARRYQAVTDDLRQPEVRARLTDAQAMPVGDTPEHFDAYCRTEAKRYADIVQLAGIRLQ
ncbi:hypothetical protein G6F23_014386 [Rhizopus arrhizus]|nr:hypothetical protein G6F23_014386 [Rhizopus arrhizus]